MNLKNQELLMNYIYKNCFLFGSRKYGGATEESDWDYIVGPLVYDRISKVLKKMSGYICSKGYENAKLFNDISISFKTANNSKINLIVYSDIKLYDVAKKSCIELEEFMKLSMSKIMENKFIRHTIIEEVFITNFKQLKIENKEL